MKPHTKHDGILALAAALLLTFAASGLADEAPEAPDTSNWVCKLCLVSTGWTGDWNLGVIYVDDPTPKFADYRGLIDDGAHLEATGFARYLNANGHYFDFYGRNLGIDSRQLDMRGGKQGRYEVRAWYGEIPRYLGNGTVTPYSGVGSDTLVLNQPVTGSEVDTSAWSPALLESKRKTYGAAFTVKLGSAWTLDAGVEQQSKDGTRNFGGGLFALNGALFPAPVDYKTNLVNAGLEYAGQRGQIRLDVLSSDFENGYSSVTWDNPFAGGWGDERSRSALEPDNEYRQISLTANWRISRRFRISGKASAGEAEQDVLFLPYSINPEYEDLPLPRDSLEGKLDTSMYNLAGRVYLMLADRLDLNIAYKVNERKNKTPIDEYTPILLEMFPMGPRSNRPYSYERSQGKAWLRWRPHNRVRLNAGFRRDTLERTYQDVFETEEDTWWGEIQFVSLAWLDTRLKYEQLKRDAEGFEEQGNYDRAENPLMRKFNMADRDRKRATLEFYMMPLERLDIVLSYYATEDDYDGSFLGLNESEETSLNLDFNYMVSESVNLYAFVTRDEIEAEMSAADGAGADPWYAFTEDDILTWGLGITGKLNEKFSIGFDYVSSEADGDILTDSGDGEEPFPTLNTSLRNARVYLKYRVNDRWGLALDAYREEYDSDDWYVDGYGPLDVSGLLTMGEVSPEYDVNVIRLFATLTF